MTALAGYRDLAGDGAGPACARMLAAQEMYGRDGTVCGGDDTVALGRALSLTLPEDTHDRGVQTGAGGRYTLVADLRLDNRDELAEALGRDLARLCDAGVAMAVIERWGEGGIVRLIGDFALILWDAETGRLMLARDYLGLRPLYYHLGDGFVAAASMPKGLHALPSVPRGADERRMIEELAGLPEHGTASFHAGIARVEPGTCVTLDADGVRVRRYWRPSKTPIRFATARDYEAGLRAELDRAVACRLRRAGGGVAAHLSAGLDSSSVAATAARLLGDAPLIAYTAVPVPGGVADDGRLTDEGPHAAAVAALHPNIAHHRIVTGGQSPLERLDRAVHLFDRPVPNLCNFVWTDTIAADAAARGVSVLLTGQYGNATISHDGTPHVAELLAGGRIGALLRTARGMRASAGMRWRGVAAMAIGPFLSRGMWRLIARRAGLLPPVARHAPLAPAVLATVQGGVTERQPWRDGRARRLDLISLFDLGPYYKGLLGGYGVDYRDPTADRRLLEYCLAIPEEQFLLDGTPRSLVRRAFADRLPPEVTGERRKGAQGEDWHLGLVAAAPEVAAQVERLAEAREAAFLDVPRLRAAAARLRDDPAGIVDQPTEYRIALLRALSIGHFARRASGSNR